MAALCLVILAVVLMSGCTTTRESIVSASDYFNAGRYADGSATCIDPNQR